MVGHPTEKNHHNVTWWNHVIKTRKSRIIPNQYVIFFKSYNLRNHMILKISSIMWFYSCRILKNWMIEIEEKRTYHHVIFQITFLKNYAYWFITEQFITWFTYFNYMILSCNCVTWFFSVGWLLIYKPRMIYFSDIYVILSISYVIYTNIYMLNKI